MTSLPDQAFTGRVALVTGASRGIGAVVARRLAGADAHVIVNYREKLPRASAVVDSIVAAGGHASVAGADLTDETASTAMVQRIADMFGRLDLLVLNASGGLEPGADPGYPMRINHDAQIRLTELALPLMPTGGRIVFITSHQAHFCGRTPALEEYVPVAVSKRAGEDALRAMQPRFDERGVEFVVVSGDMIDGTILVRLLERRKPEVVGFRRIHGDLPTVEEFAGAIVTAATGPAPVADTIYVGGQDYLGSNSVGAELRRYS
ncbi:SDR family oxidoreductase [Mycobacterium sp.]|uniref:SDR family oxidoreductase n=1 Tax=Mycobacterium sp. TaxID=1785 RepID=UPI002DA7F7E3|nr:SDR family oxidoreductase [Mycobacterium sp.]